MRRLAAWIALLLMPLVVMAAPQVAQRADDDAVDAIETRATDALKKGDFVAAREALGDLLKHKPENPAAHYNLACALAQLGDADKASDELLESISLGFVDLFHMSADPHLAPIHNTRTYQGIVLGWRELLDARGESVLEAAQKALGKRYHYLKDDRLRLIYAASFDQKTFDEARSEIEDVAKWAFEHVFTSLSFDSPDNATPDPWVSVLLPTPEDFVRIVHTPNIGGYYDHDRRRLISQDIGPSFRHEFLHVLHWRDMTRRHQRHPDWVTEGLGSLVEDMDLTSRGALAPAPSWRTNITKRLDRFGRLPPLRELLTMPHRRFVTSRPNAHYAWSRSFMLFLFEAGRLGDWYDAYTGSFDDDPTGARALERVFQSNLDDIDKQFRLWLRDLPEVAEVIRPGMASLGVVIGAGRGDGPRIEEIVKGTGAREAGLHLGDVITAIDGRSTRTMEDLVRILSAYEPDDRVELEIRRGARTLTIPFTLITR